MESDGSFALAVPPEPDQVRTARLFAAAVARHYGAEEERVEDLKVAISEAATNSIKAHRAARIADPIRVAAAPVDGELHFSVIDVGPGFAPSQEQSAVNDPPTPVTGLFEGSLGLSLIRSLFPNVRIERNPSRGVTVSFTVEIEPPKDGAE
ncbi:MAG: ATP-binding protein [Actinomycetota bacterium]